MAAVLSPIANPQPAAPPARNGDARGGEFARCLDQARESDGAAAVEPAGANGTAEADQAGEASNAPPRPAAKARSSRETTPSRKGEPHAAKEAPAKTAVEADAAVEGDAASSRAPRTDAAAPDMAALLPGWSPPAPAAATMASCAKAPDGADTLQGAAAATGVTLTSPASRDAAAARVTTALAAAAPQAAAAATPNPQTTEPAASAALEMFANEQRELLPIAASATPPVPLPVAFTAAPTAPRLAEPALPTATVASPIDTPAFAPALATQVRWWAHDGVQQAQLMLNPADMGPVAVKIVLDGREARIDFSADMAATRSAIEAALPVLAAALDDGGLKLCGGGVHDGSAQRQSDWHQRSVTQRTLGSASAHADEAPGEPSAQVAAAGRGLVDLVA